ncbi:MAG TPA: hypothetical protein VMV46_17790 [Thermoanaerobaculia bacterium]|nr:hypothetical protein [Thermoanaerobaculia bacterium]
MRGEIPSSAILLALAALALAPARSQAPAATSVEAGALMPLAIGDRWLFGNPAGDPAREPAGSLMVSEAAARGVRLDDEEGNTRQVVVDPERGLLLLAVESLDGVRHRFDPPLALLPPVLQAGTSHHAESAVSEEVDGEATRRGLRRLEVTIAAPAPLSTPAGEWRAWRVVTGVTTTWEGDPQAVAAREEVWYAPGVGPVRRRSDREPPRDEVLLEAVVGGRLIPPP